MNKIQDKFLNSAQAIQNNIYVKSISDGLLSSMSIIILGAIGSLINNLQIPAYQNLLISLNLKPILSIPANVTINVLSLYATFLIANKFCELSGKENSKYGLEAGVIALVSFLVVTPFNTDKSFSITSLPSEWLGAKGLFASFIVALVVAKLYIFLKKKGWTIKMPDGVPPTVSNSFAALVPSFAITFIFLAIRFLFSITEFQSLQNFIYTIISTPLTMLSNNAFTMILLVFLTQLLWIFGIHGVMIVVSVFIGIWMPLDAANLAAFNAGHAIPNIYTGAIYGMATFAGSGLTIGLCIAMLTAHKEQYRILGRLSLIPNLFGINEPLIFGTPIVMNPILAIPFIITPLVGIIIAILGIKIGILPILPGISVPTGTPIILHGFLAGGGNIPWAVYELVICILSYFIYLPFFKKLDLEPDPAK